MLAPETIVELSSTLQVDSSLFGHSINGQSNAATEIYPPVEPKTPASDSNAASLLLCQVQLMQYTAHARGLSVTLAQRSYTVSTTSDSTM